MWFYKIEELRAAFPRMATAKSIVVTALVGLTACAGQLCHAQTLPPATLTIQRFEGRVLAGEVIALAFIVGTPSRPVAQLFGLSFELQYSMAALVQPLTPDQATSGAFLEPNTYSFARHEAERRSVALAVSRKRGDSGQSGFGEVLRYAFQVLPTAPEGAEICFAITNIAAHDSAGNAIPLVAGAPLCVKIAERAIEVAPNPFTPNADGINDQVEFRREGGIPPEWSIIIMDRAGRVVRRLREGVSQWNGRDEQQRAVLPEVYLYLIQNGDQIVTRGVVGLIR